VTTYAVKWREPDGQTFIGRLALGARALLLDGRRRGASEPPVERRFGYEELRGLRIGNAAADRLDGRPALVIERADGPYLVADAGLGAPIVQELVERLTDLRLCAARKAVVVVPLQDGALERVRELVSHGPPFDPAETGLTRHELLLTSSEAIFVFEAESEEALGLFLSRLDVSAVAAWGELVAGPPRLADCAFSWERSDLPGVGLGF
jgi:hypothetical protein